MFLSVPVSGVSSVVNVDPSFWYEILVEFLSGELGSLIIGVYLSTGVIN